MRSTVRETSTTLRTLLVFLLATVPTAGAAVAGGGPCFSVSLDSPVVLPGSGEFPAGNLRICVSHKLSPVTAMHKAYMNGEPVAMLLSRHSVGESEASGDGRPFVVFERDSRGRLHLYGLAARASRGATSSFHLHDGDGLARETVASRFEAPGSDRDSGGEGTVLMAATDPVGRRK